MLRQRASKRCQARPCGQDTEVTAAGFQPGMGWAMSCILSLHNRLNNSLFSQSGGARPLIEWLLQFLIVKFEAGLGSRKEQTARWP